MRKLLVIGHRGMLGREVFARAGQRGAWTVAGADVEELDIREPDCADSPLLNDAAVIVNCAAYTDVDGAESDRGAAFAVNRDGVANLARAAKRRNALLVHLSTDFVFDGKCRDPYAPGDTPHPLNAYGESKCAGEAALFNSGCRYLLLRTSWLFGKGGRNFVDTILSGAETQETLRVVCDQTGRPTYAADLAGALLDLCRNGCEGIFHFGNSGVATWHQFACEIVKQAKLPVRVEPCTTEEFPRPAIRPACSVLDLSATVDALGREPRAWQAALAEYLSRRAG